MQNSMHGVTHLLINHQNNVFLKSKWDKIPKAESFRAFTSYYVFSPAFHLFPGFSNYIHAKWPTSLAWNVVDLKNKLPFLKAFKLKILSFLEAFKIKILFFALKNNMLHVLLEAGFQLILLAFWFVLKQFWTWIFFERKSDLAAQNYCDKKLWLI